jgi:hypothetical protein
MKPGLGNRLFGWLIIAVILVFIVAAIWAIATVKPA